MQKMTGIYITLFDEKTSAEIEVDGWLGRDFQNMVRQIKWLKWEKRKLEDDKDKWILLADLSDKEDVDEYGCNRLKRLCIKFCECGAWLQFRIYPNTEWDSDMDRYVWDREY